MENNNITASTQTPTGFPTLSQIIRTVTEEFIAQHPVLPSEENCTSSVVDLISIKINFENATRPKGMKMRFQPDIPVMSIAMLIAARGDVALIAPGDKSQTGKKKVLTTEQRMSLPIGIYQTDGDNEGVWELTNSPTGAIGVLIERYKPSATVKEKNEVFALLKSRLGVREKCMIPYYVPVNNGIVDVLNKQLLPFSPDLVFTSKIHTALNLAATNPILTIPEDGSVWDVDGWLDSLGDPEFVFSIKEVIQAACLPLAPRDQMCLLYSRSGNNGKGTICQLIRNLLGEESTISIPINEFSGKFSLTNLPKAMAIITDENDVSAFSKGLSVIKAVITGDTVTVERKYQDPYDYSFNGLVLQCVNDLPKVDDKTGSFKRRLHIIPFDQCFTGKQKRYIKDRLIYREDVLEYILKTVLIDMPYRDKFTETDASREALKKYTIMTNSVVSFLDEILPECRLNLLPATDFLYEIYKIWYRENSPSGKVIGRNEFLESIRDYAATDPEWEWTESTRSQGYIDSNVYEPLLAEYRIFSLTGNPFFDSYKEGHINPEKLKSKYSGLKRRGFSPSTQGSDND